MHATLARLSASPPPPTISLQSSLFARLHRLALAPKHAGSALVLIWTPCPQAAAPRPLPRRIAPACASAAPSFAFDRARSRERSRPTAPTHARVQLRYDAHAPALDGSRTSALDGVRARPRSTVPACPHSTVRAHPRSPICTFARRTRPEQRSRVASRDLVQPGDGGERERGLSTTQQRYAPIFLYLHSPVSRYE
jgi:hypothetical protein